MASLIPSLNSCVNRMQSGEKRFARRLISHLEDDYLCWFESAVGNRLRYCDFIVMHPARGLLLLEVKDWKLETIQKIDRVTATILTSQGIKSVSNPLEQVRQCTYQLLQRLSQDPQLVQVSGRYKGSLVFPYGYGVVLSNITRTQFIRTDLGEVLPTHQVICKDEMTESVEVEDFQARLWNMFNVQFTQPMTLPQIDRVRWHLFPEVRISSGDQADFFPTTPEKECIDHLLPDIVKVMDMQQETLARSMGEGHRVIHGVAGSGKTLILGYRCLYLAKILSKPILVLCYNITLAARLRELIQERQIADKVLVHHFHDWCGEQLRTYHVAKPTAGKRYFDDLVETVISAVDKGNIPTGQYGAVLIDEGHDFEPEWLKLVVGMVDSTNNFLLLLYDDAQSIYGNKASLDFTLSSVGVQARGRTTVLKVNYRNTSEILSFAYNFAKNYLSAISNTNDEVPLIEPESAGRRGPVPSVRTFQSYDEEAAYIAHILKRVHDEQGRSWSDMCAIFRSNWMGQKLYDAMKSLDIPCRLLKNSSTKKTFNISGNQIKLMTMHSSKGLEFPIVVVSGVGSMPVKGEEPLPAAKLLYVAMTRATEKLLITSHKETEFCSQLKQIAATATAEKA